MFEGCCCSAKDEQGTVNVEVQHAIAKPTAAFEEEIAPVPKPKNPCVELVFALPGGGERLLKAEQKPLGVGFEEEVPLVVKVIRAGSVAEHLQIQPEWKLKKVDGTDVFNTSVDAAFDALANAFKGLPDKS
mmetsp:Transcript_63264/g.142272  ORF Transcript_63264/g.142272 Transcript_63264/m.142272 type:complete len:131 (-) Transcript_63264:289-681(-)